MSKPWKEEVTSDKSTYVGSLIHAHKLHLNVTTRICFLLPEALIAGQQLNFVGGNWAAPFNHALLSNDLANIPEAFVKRLPIKQLPRKQGVLCSHCIELARARVESKGPRIEE